MKPLDCIECRRASADLSQASASTIPDTDLCAGCLEVEMRRVLKEIVSLRKFLRDGYAAGRDVLPPDLLRDTARELWTR